MTIFLLINSFIVMTPQNICIFSIIVSIICMIISKYQAVLPKYSIQIINSYLLHILFQEVRDMRENEVVNILGKRIKGILEKKV